MTKNAQEFLVLSRGQWDADAAPEDIQDAIDRFYAWHDRMVEEGKMIAGQRLAREGKVVSRERVMDGPFAESKEVVGGYWFVRASTLEEAAELMTENPCVAYGLSFELRPLETEKASAFKVSNETPSNPSPART